MSANIPHFAIPFRIVAGAAVVNEQGSPADIQACAAAVIRYPQGACVELPEFGIPDQALRENGGEPGEITTAVATWEPRATLAMTESEIADLAETIRIEIGAA